MNVTQWSKKNTTGCCRLRRPTKRCVCSLVQAATAIQLQCNFAHLALQQPGAAAHLFRQRPCFTDVINAPTSTRSKGLTTKSLAPTCSSLPGFGVDTTTGGRINNSAMHSIALLAGGYWPAGLFDA